MLKLNTIVLATACIAALSACSSTKTVAVKAVSADMKGMGLKEVIVVDQSGSNSKTILDNAKKGFGTALGKCMNGTSIPVRAELTISGYKSQNGAMTMLIASGSNMTGTVKLINADSGEELGNYNLSRSKSGAGIIGAAYMAGSEGGLPAGMAEDLCKKLNLKSPK
jgi:hypothetical protein